MARLPAIQYASVYCILESFDRGGSRVIVCERHNPWAHTGEGEKAIRVPSYMVAYPPPMERFYEIVCAAEKEGKRHTNSHRFST